MREKIMKNCLETLQFLSRTTNEILYLCDMDTEKLYLADDYAEKFQLPFMKEKEYALKEMQQFIYSKSGERAFFRPETFEHLPGDTIYQEYYVPEGKGKLLKLFCTEKMHCDLESRPRWIIGHVTDILNNIGEEEMKGLREERMLQEELKKSIEDDFRGFSIRYYPRVDAKTCQMCEAEAILCYHNQSGEWVPQERFMPILERMGLEAKTDRWVLKNALIQCRKWRETLPDMHMIVRLSMSELKETGIWEQVLTDLEELELPGSVLTLEMAENLHMKDHQAFNRIFFRMRSHGIRIAIDNFETGYSSMNYLKVIMIDEIQVEPGIISGIQNSAYNYRLLSNLIELARASRIKVGCKGVETEGELQALKELHPDTLQGYLFGKPMSAEKFEENYIRKDTEAYHRMQENVKRHQSLKGRKHSLEEEYVRYEKMAAILDGMDEIIYVTDVENDEILYLNATGREATGYYDYSGRKCHEVMFGHGEPCAFCQKCHVQEESYHIWEHDSKHLKRHFLVKNKLILWTGKKANLMVCIDITEKENMSKAAAAMDPLTGAYNRKAFEEKVGEHIHRSNGGKGSSVLMIDVDNFKQINDQNGHLAGDQVLKEMVQALRETFRREDMIGRLGGDEFVVFLKDLTDREIIEKRIMEFQKRFCGMNLYQATCSIGIANVEKEGYSYQKSIEQADIALYQSKAKGKDTFCFYEK